MDKKSWVAIGIAIVAVVIAVVGGNSQPQIDLGASGTRFPNGVSTNSTSPDAGEVQTTTITVGSSGTQTSKLVFASCTLIFAGGTNNTVAASSTVQRDCAVTGLVAGDTVVAQIATSSIDASGLKWALLGASASSTSGYATLQIANLAGASALIPSSIASSGINVIGVR